MPVDRRRKLRGARSLIITLPSPSTMSIVSNPYPASRHGSARSNSPRARRALPRRLMPAPVRSFGASASMTSTSMP